jgi:hypothetical protein
MLLRRFRGENTHFRPHTATYRLRRLDRLPGRNLLPQCDLAGSHLGFMSGAPAAGEP